MDDEERLISALNELSEVKERNRLKREGERKREAVAADRRKRLKELFYKKVSPISKYISKESLLIDVSDE